MTGIAIEPARCRTCGTELAPSLLACPSCRALVHANHLTRLAERARRHEEAGRAEEAIADWREALALLPSDAGQHAAIAARIEELSVRKMPAAPTANGTQVDARQSANRPSAAKRGAAIGALAPFLWKFKVVIPFLLTKGKLLLVSIPKMGGMLLGLGASLGIYWAAWGWQFAVGFIASIYVHELGHVVAMRRHGIPSSAPMFIPGFGAYVRMHRMPKDETEDARIGLAGPLAGLVAAVICAAIYFLSGNALFAALAKFGALINLVNLVPVWHLDGARAFSAFSKRDRWIAIASLVGGAVMSGSLAPLAVALVCLVRLASPEPAKRDGASLALFAFVVLALSALLTLPVPGLTPR